MDRGPFSEIWTKARATPHNSIFHYFVDMFYVFKKSAEIGVRAKTMCSLKFGSTKNKKTKKNDNSGDDV